MHKSSILKGECSLLTPVGNSISVTPLVSLWPSAHPTLLQGEREETYLLYTLRIINLTFWAQNHHPLFSIGSQLCTESKIPPFFPIYKHPLHVLMLGD